MLTPSQDIVQLLSPFATAMTAPTFAKALVLLYGVILTPGRRTVASALRVMGYSHKPNPSKYVSIIGFSPVPAGRRCR